MQSCVVTLEPVPAHLEVDLDMSYSAAAVGPAVAELDPLGHATRRASPPEIDLGEAVARQLAIALDPYPRAPGASLEALEEARKQGGRGARNPEPKLAFPKKKARPGPG